MKLEKGMPAPDFETTDGTGKTWRLSDLKGQKVILYFYPADDTPGCTAQACDFRDSQSEWQKAGYVVLGVSGQGVESHKAFADKFSLNFPLLVDEDLKIAEAYGTQASQPGDYDGIPLTTLRSTFVIDANGIIEEAIYGQKGRTAVGELRDLLKV